MNKKITVKAATHNKSNNTTEESHVSDNEVVPKNNASGFIGSYGDPKKWAKSTLKRKMQN